MKLYSILSKLGRASERLQVKMMMKRGLVPYQPDPFDIVDNIAVDRDQDATRQRWELIRPYLPTQPFTALDVGCNLGFFSFMLARSGADHVVGMDIERGPLLIAEKLKVLGRVSNVGFITVNLDHNNVHLLGEYDVILFMSVFHHLVDAHDMTVAKRVLSGLIARTRKVLIFETGQGDQTFGKMASAMPAMEKSQVASWLEQLLLDCGASSVEAIGSTAVKHNAERLLIRVTP